MYPLGTYALCLCAHKHVNSTLFSVIKERVTGMGHESDRRVNCHGMWSDVFCCSYYYMLPMNANVLLQGLGLVRVCKFLKDA